MNGLSGQGGRSSTPHARRSVASALASREARATSVGARGEEVAGDQSESLLAKSKIFVKWSYGNSRFCIPGCYVSTAYKRKRPLSERCLDAELDVGLCGLLLGLAEDVDVPLGLVLERDVEPNVVVLAELLDLLDVVLVELNVERLEV